MISKAHSLVWLQKMQQFIGKGYIYEFDKNDFIVLHIVLEDKDQ